MADERLNDLENARMMDNNGIVDTGDSERAQQENLVTQAVQARYEETRAKRIAKQNTYTTLLGEYKVLEGRYDTNRAGKKLSLSFNFPNDPAGLEAALDNDAELIKLKADLDVEKAKLDAAEAEYRAEQAVEEAYKKEWEGLKEGLSAGKPIGTVLNEVPITNEEQVREQARHPQEENEPPVQEQTPSENEQHKEPEPVQNGPQNMDDPIPESALPKAETLHTHDFEKGYMPGAERAEVQKNNPDADWAKVMERVLSEQTPEAIADAMFTAILTYPLALAAYHAELHAAEKKGKIKYVDEQAASWNKTMRSLKGLSEADVLQAIQGDFLHDPEGLIARYNKDVYEGLKTNEDGRYTGEQVSILNQRIADKEAELKQTNPELFVGIERGKDGRYSAEDAEVFRTRFLMHMHPDLLAGIQKDKDGAYSEKDVALFKERLLTKNFETVYERQPTIRERVGMVGGFKNRDQMNSHIKAQEGIYGLALGMTELAIKEQRIPDSITHDMAGAWENLRNAKGPFKDLKPGLEKAYVDVPTAREKYQEWHEKLQGRTQERVEPTAAYTMAAPPPPEFHIDPQKGTESPYVAPTPQAPDIFIAPQPATNSPYVAPTPQAQDVSIAPQPVKDDVHVTETANVTKEAVVPKKRDESYSFVSPTLNAPQVEKPANQMPERTPPAPELVVQAEVLPDNFKVPEDVKKVEPVSKPEQTVEATRPVHPTNETGMPTFGVTPPTPMAAPQNPIQMSQVTVTSVERPETTVNRTPTTLNKAHENLNAAGTIDAMKTEKSGLDKVVSGLKSKEQHLTVDGQLLSKLRQNVTVRTPENGLGRTNDQHSM